MKKIFIFLSICLLAVTGFFFACSNDKYADLKIYVESVYSNSTGKAVTYKDGYYEVNYGETFSVKGRVTSSSDISKRLLFDSVNESVFKLPSQTETNDGSIASFKANQPSYGSNYYTIKISSIETSRNAIYLKLKVILPVSEIILQDNMAITKNNNVDLFDKLTYISTNPDSGFMTTQKGVNFNILSFTYGTTTIDYTLEGNENYKIASGNSTTYCVKENENFIPVFKITNGVVDVLNSSYIGVIKVEARSTEFNTDIYNQKTDVELLKAKPESERTPEEKQLIANFDKNEHLRKEVEIDVIRDLSFSDFEFTGGQTGFKPNNNNSKLNASLYLNSLANYYVEGIPYSYLFEQVNFTLNANSKVDFSTKEVKLADEDNDGQLDEIATGIINSSVVSTYAYEPSINAYEYNGQIRYGAAGNAGTTYYDIIFTYSDFSNKPSFSFYNMYKQYLASLEEGVDRSGIKGDYELLCFDVSAIASNIAIYQNDGLINFDEGTPEIKVYDSYNPNFNNGYGTKISVNLALTQDISSSKIKNENKKIKVTISAEGEIDDFSKYIEIIYPNGNAITLQGSNHNYFYMPENNNYFYAKAKSGSGYANFTFTFENELSSTISTFATNENVGSIGYGSTAEVGQTPLQNAGRIVNIRTIKGVNNIKVFAINNEADFEEVDETNLTTNNLYKTITVRLFSEDPLETQGVLLGIVVDDNTSDNLTITPEDNKVVKVFDLASSYKSNFSTLAIDDGLMLLRAVSIAGLKLGETVLNFVAENGEAVTVSVKVVNALDSTLSRSFNLSVNQNYGRNVVTQSNLSNTSLKSGTAQDVDNVNGDAIISVKVRGSFTLNYNVAPDATSLIGVKYVVKYLDEDGNVVVDTTKIKINNKTGQITANSVGTYYVFVEFSYYKFQSLTEGLFLTWGEEALTKAFKLEVYEPATSIKLDKYVVNAYDYNSLGYEDAEKAIVRVGVNILPYNASILSNTNAITYSVSNSTYLSGANGFYTAKLGSKQTKTTEYIYVTVTEYGVQTTLVCTVNIVKAVQIEEIKVNIFDGDKQQENKSFPKDLSTIYVSTKNSRSLSVNTVINPGSNVVYNNDLLVKLFKARSDGTININSPEELDAINDSYLATLSYRDVNEVRELVLVNGEDTFTINVSDTLSGYFYVVIYAKDSMTAANNGKVYTKILVEVTDGSLEHPYTIKTISDLMEIEDAPSKHYVLEADINLGSISNWAPLAPDGFTGSLNGYNANVANKQNNNGTFFSISGLKINNANSEDVGLFAKLSSRFENDTEVYYGAILNLTLNVSYISLKNKTINNNEIDEVNIGCLAGTNEGGLIMNCSVNVNNYDVYITNKQVNVGGLVGVNREKNFVKEGGVVHTEQPAIINVPNNNLKSNAYNLMYDKYGVNSYVLTTKAKYSEGKIVKELNENLFASTNPFNITLNVSDNKKNYAANVGGIAGKMIGGEINGIYGTYDYIDKSQTNTTSYLTAYESQGFDVDVNINSNLETGGTIINPSTTIGGVVGKMENGNIYNTSSCGQIGNSTVTVEDSVEEYNINGALNNVGGLVGSACGTDEDFVKINNILANVKLRASSNIGGIIGYAKYTEVYLARVENYEDEDASGADIALIVLAKSNSYLNSLGYEDSEGLRYVGGGVVGYNEETELSYTYFDSFINMLNPIYAYYGDIFANIDDAKLGGIIGWANEGSLSYSYVSANINAYNGKVGGLIGSEICAISDVYFVGVLNGINLTTLLNEDNTPFCEDLELAIGGYYYYYLLCYDNEYTVVKESKIYAGDETAISEENGNLNFWGDTINTISYEGLSGIDQTAHTRVLKYKEESKYYNFIKLVPNSITVETKPGSVNQFTNTTAEYDNSNYFIQFAKEGDSKLYLIAKLLGENNTFALNSLFNVIATPNTLGRLNIVVSFRYNGAKTNLISVSSSGDITLNGLTGNYPIEIKFSVKENIAANYTVYLYVVENFDELLVSNLPSYSTNLFDKTEAKPYDIRKNTETNIFEVIGEYVSDASGKIVYKTNSELKSLVAIENLTNYVINYEVKKQAEGYVNATAEDYVKNGTSVVFKQEGLYQITASITFELAGLTFTYTDDSWVFYYNAYSGATAINFNTNEVWMESNQTYRDLVLTLNTDAVLSNGISLNMVLTNENGAKYLPSFAAEHGVLDDINSTYGGRANLKQKEIVFVNEYDSTDRAFVKLVINDIIDANNIHTYNFYLKVDENKKDLVKDQIYYTLSVCDDGDVLINQPAIVSIVLVPQGIRGVNAVHYRYTQSVSKLTNTTNTNGQTDETNYAYNFTNEPKNTVVAGNDGLFVIDLYPYYAKINSVSIESTLVSGNSLQFVQLVRVKDGASPTNYSYIYAPTATSTGNGGIYLKLYSDAYDSHGELSEIISIDGVRTVNEIARYAFTPLNDGSEMGRLYVKTIAPTNLKEEESFRVIIKVNFTALNDNNEYVEQEFVYEHVLVVESVSDYSLNITHNNTQRNNIAVTSNVYTGIDSGADWLDLDLYIDETFTSGKINVSYVSPNNDDKGANSDYVNVLPVGNKTRVVLGSKAEVGAKIRVDVVLEVEYDGFVEQRVFSHYINVVDLIIESVEIKGAEGTDVLNITVSTSKQLSVTINGFGSRSVMERAENQISRMINVNQNSIYYWYANVENSNKYYVGLDSADIKGLLPFSVKKVAISNEQDSLSINGEEVYTALQKVVIVEGLTSSGSVKMLLNFSYIYIDEVDFRSVDGKSKGRITFVPNGYIGASSVYKYFTVVVKEDSNEDHPTPIYNVEGLLEMSSSKGGNFILMNDIEISSHTALNAEFNSFDGNNKVITINSFAYSSNLASSNNTYSINMGLFNTVASGTIIKNVIVALPTRVRDSAMDLTGYSTINFGAIAAINNGIITNCDVISVADSSVNQTTYFSSVMQNYTINIETNDIINQTDVTANIGLFVGVNQSSGVITNSRVGREKVEILSVYDSQATVVYKSDYTKTVPITVVKVFGRANVGGFAATNNGIISSSYAKNLQIENISKSAKSFVKTSGFVVDNNGYIYGSYSAGWEEEQMSNLAEDVRVSENRKLGGGIFSNGSVAGFVYSNTSYIEDCYSNINCSGDLTFAANSSYVYALKAEGNFFWSAPAAAGFVYISTEGSYITTSYSLSKIELNTNSSRPNTFGAFEGRMESPDAEFDNSGTIENCYFLLEKAENFSYDHERAVKLTNDPAIVLEGEEELTGINEFINKSSFNNFSFDNSFDAINSFNPSDNISTGGVWAIYAPNGTSGYPELISANTIAISCRVINVTKTNEETNTFYYTYVDNYELGSYLNPYMVSSFSQFNNIFKDTIGSQSFNDEVTTKFTGNIRLINNINFEKSEDVYSTNVEYTSNAMLTSIFDGNYLSIYNMALSDKSTGRSSFGLFKDIYYASVKNLALVVDSVNAGNTIAVGALAGAIVNSNISNITLAASERDKGIVVGNNYVGGLAGLIITSDDGELYTVANVKSNLSVVGSISTADTVNAITTSGVIWERIKPVSSSSGLSAISSNIKLHKLPQNVFYAGGIAGIVDVYQKKEVDEVFEIVDPNVKNIHVGDLNNNLILSTGDISYSNNIKILSDYAGGVFGLVGGQTYVERVNFIAGTQSENHYISGNQIAGGLAAVNFGKISQSYVSFSESTIDSLDEQIKEYVKQDSEASVHINSTLFSYGQPKYVGGLVGITVGNGRTGSGSIINCYNRVDVRNDYAIGVGGIVGGAYIGDISNVYTTASLKGKLFTNNTKTQINTETRIGAIVGKIFENSNEGYFADYHLGGSNAVTSLTLVNIVAVNLWDSDDFDDLYTYCELGGTIGALYGKYINDTASGDRFVRISTKVFIQKYVLRNYNDSYISSVDIESTFDINSMSEPESFIEMWGASEESGSSNFDSYIYTALGDATKALITPNKYRALLSETGTGLREDYFPPVEWSRIIWNYDAENLLPILKYGYESSVIRIYTAQQFVDKLTLGNSSGKLYVIMNDIDFSGYVFGKGDDTNVKYVDIKTIFRGQLYGNNVTYTEGGTKYTRKPILFNITISGEGVDSYAGMFASSIGATFANFNIVIKEYNVSFASNETETVASVLVANSVSTNINNVHIYSSLTDNINREIFNIDYEFYSEDLKNQAISVCDGYSMNSDKKIVGYMPYLRLATPDSIDERDANFFGANDQWFYVYNNNRYELSKFRVSDGSTESGYQEYAASKENFALVKDNLSARIQKIKTSAQLTAMYNQLSIIQINSCYNNDETENFKIENARTVGLLTGIGALPYISNSSVNVDVSVYIQLTTPYVYVGKIAGRIVGQVVRVVATKDLSLKLYDVGSGFNPDNISSDNGVIDLFAGGLVGKLQGAADICYVKELNIYFGQVNLPICARSGCEGSRVGGAFGDVSRYSTVNDSVVGGIYNIYSKNSLITAYISGSSKIGGLIGQNEYGFGQSFNIQDNSENKIKVITYGSSTNASIGGLIAENNYSKIIEVYSNTSIDVTINGCAILRVGGIVGVSNTEITFDNVMCDAKNITIDSVGATNEDKVLCTQYVGGILGVTGTTADVYLQDVFSSVDIQTIQASKASIGGMVGGIERNLYIHRGISLGNITLAERKTFADGVFTLDDQYIGGLAGSCKDVLQIAGAPTFIVLSTIRDYAIAQKIGKLNIGPVIGTNKEGSSTSTLEVYYNENISLVADNGYKDYFKNIDQCNENLYNALLNVLGDFTNYFNKNKINENEASSLFSSYVQRTGGYTFRNGSKLKPTEFAGSITRNAYYILKSDYQISDSISIPNAETNWVLNAQGYRFYSTTDEEGNNVYKLNKAIFSNISKGGAVVGLVEDVDVLSLRESAIIANTNNGFIFSCGVGGSIEGQKVASLAYTNLGVVSTSFSVADITVTSYAGTGLVMINGNSSVTGNTLCCYYTGSLITAAGVGSGTTVTGLCSNTTDGVISNCYTMADMNVASNVTTYPITAFNNPSRLYKCFYDYVSYTGANEGVSIEDAKENGYITNCGIYVWSSSLSGSAKGRAKITNDAISKLLQGNWSEPGDVSQLETLFRRTDEYPVNNNDYEIKIDTSWFNYGYLTLNYNNILFNEKTGDPSDTDDNIMRYLQLIYTGNGLANQDGKVWSGNSLVNADPGVTNGFADKPYSVKNAGILDVLVNANNDDVLLYKYYLVLKNISFIKYTGKTYWSKNWDDNFICFLGDFDGNNKTISNLYSSFGLLRVLPKIEGEPQSNIHDITFTNCYSKTGIVAGAMYDGKLDAISLNNCTVYNGSLSRCKDSEGNIKVFTSVAVKFDSESTNSFETKNYNEVKYDTGTGEVGTTANNLSNFAGGLVGFMSGGTILSSCNFNSSMVVASNAKNGNVATQTFATYAGGIAGFVQNGTIGQESGDAWQLTGLTVFAQDETNGTKNNIYVGGLVGYLGGEQFNYGILQNIEFEDISVGGPANVGGAVGLVEGYGRVVNVVNKSSSGLNIANYEVLRGASSFQITPINNNIVSYNIYAGGIAAQVKSDYTYDTYNADPNKKVSSIYNSSVKDSFALSSSNTTLNLDASNEIYRCVGGIVGHLVKGVILKCSIEDDGNVSCSEDRAIAGGIVAKMDGGLLLGNKVAESTNNVSSSLIAGGIVGYLTNGSVGKQGSSSDEKNTSAGDITSVTSEDGIAGGIVGCIICEGANTCNIFETEASSLVKGKLYSGGIVGYTYNSSSNEVAIKSSQILASAKVGDDTNANKAKISGGIVGFAYGANANNRIVIENCKAQAKVYAKEDEGCFAGGIIGVGYNVSIGETNNADTTNTGDVNGGYITGGVAGYLENCVMNLVKSTNNIGTVSGGVIAGGIIGITSNVIIEGRLINSGPVYNNQAGIAGGIIGVSINKLTVEDTTATMGFVNRGSVGKIGSGDGNSYIAGGVVGWLNEISSSTENTTGAVKNWQNFSPYVVAKGIEPNDNCPKMFEMVTEENGEPTVFVKVQTSSGNSSSLLTATENSAGGIVGYLNGKLKANALQSGENGGASSAVESNNYAGGIIGFIAETSVGDNDIIITNTKNYSSVNGSTAGGIVSAINNKINIMAAPEYEEETLGMTFNPVINYGTVTGVDYAGGIAGIMASGSIKGNAEASKYVQNAATIIATANEGAAGGIVGNLTGGKIEDAKGTMLNSSKSTVKTSGGDGEEHPSAGGLVGLLQGGTIGRTCNLDGSTSSPQNEVQGDNYGYAGGLVGTWESGLIEAANSAGGVTSVTITYVNVTSGLYSGGIVGYQKTTTNTTLAGTISSGTVTGSTAAGGAVGRLKNGNIQTDASGVTTIKGSVYTGGLVGEMAGGTISGGKGGKPTIEVEGVSAGGLVGLMINGTVSGGEGGQVGNTTGSVFAERAGGAVGYMMGGEVKDGVTITKLVKGKTYVGGLVGYMDGTNAKVSGGNLYNPSTSIESSKTTDDYVGGLVGYMQTGTVAGGILSSSENTGFVPIAGKKNVGGLVGYMNAGTISGGNGGQASSSDGNANVGGIVGYMKDGTISGGSAGTASGGKYVGGFVGYMQTGVISGGNGNYSRATGGSNASVGGIVGYMQSGSIKNSSKLSGGVYIAGALYAGSMVGEMVNGEITGNLSSTLQISVNGTNAGGLVGKMSGGSVASDVPSNITVGGTNVGGVVGLVGGSINIGTSKVEATLAANKNGLIGAIDSGLTNSTSVYIAKSINITSNCKYAITQTNNVSIGSDSLKTITSSCPSLVDTNKGTLAYLKANLSGDVTVTSSTTTGSYYGVIANTNDGASGSGYIYNCQTNSINVTFGASKSVGGIAGINTGGAVIKNCTSNVSIKNTISGSIQSGIYIGGITSKNSANSKIIDCSNKGDVESNGSNCHVGGISGENSGELMSCHNNKTIINKGSGTYFGGISGENSGAIYQCNNAQAIKNNASNDVNIKFGGIVGKNRGTIDDCENNGSIAASNTEDNKASSSNLGGVVGENDTNAIVSGCRNKASVQAYPDTRATSIKIGGIAGSNKGIVYSCTNSSSVAINAANAASNVWDTGLFNNSKVKTEANIPGYAGGLVGYAENNSQTYGSNSGSITNLVKATTEAKSATITDYRGQIAGAKGENAVVKAEVHAGYTANIGSGYVTYEKIYLVAGYARTTSASGNWLGFGVRIDQETFNEYKTSYYDPSTINDLGDFINNKLVALGAGNDSTLKSGNAWTLYCNTISHEGDTNRMTKWSGSGGSLSSNLNLPVLQWGPAYSSFVSQTIADAKTYLGSGHTIYRYLDESNLESEYGLAVYFYHNFIDPTKYAVMELLVLRGAPNDSQTVNTYSKLQDCGGSVFSSNTAQTENGNRIIAIQNLYNLCGPCDDSSITVTAPTVPTTTDTEISGVTKPADYSYTPSGNAESASTDMLGAALQEYAEGAKYSSGTGLVNACAEACGYNENIIPRKSTSENLRTEFVNKNQYDGATFVSNDKGYNVSNLDIQAGDLVFLDLPTNNTFSKSANNVGIVESVRTEGSVKVITTIEGNRGEDGEVSRITYRSDGIMPVMGFARPNYASAYQSGALDVELTGDYLTMSQNLSGIEIGCKLASTALQIKQAGAANFVYGGLNSSGVWSWDWHSFNANYYSTSAPDSSWKVIRNVAMYDKNGAYKGVLEEFHYKGNICWSAPEVITAIMKGKKWTTDCCGFIRLCLALNGKSSDSGYTSPNVFPIEPNLTVASSLQSGDLVYNKSVPHILMFICRIGNKLYFADESNIRTGVVEGNSVRLDGYYNSYLFSTFYHWS